MNTVLKPKSYGPIKARFSKPGSVCCSDDSAQKVSVGATPDNNVASPADLLLAALASCMVMSLEMVAKSMQVSVTEIHSTVIGEKATSLPHRFERFKVEIGFTTSTDINVDELLKKTKNLCTISNTLAAEIELVRVPT